MSKIGGDVLVAAIATKVDFGFLIAVAVTQLCRASFPFNIVEQSCSPFNALIGAVVDIAPDRTIRNKVEIKGMVKVEERAETVNKKTQLKSRETILTGIDDIMISRGARLILFLPIAVVVLFGLAQSYRGSVPSWWEGGVQELFFDLSFSNSVYLLALAIMVTDLVLLFVLHYLLWVTKRIFQIETDEIVSTGITFRSSHGYSEMKAVIEKLKNNQFLCFFFDISL